MTGKIELQHMLLDSYKILKISVDSLSSCKYILALLLLKCISDAKKESVGINNLSSVDKSLTEKTYALGTYWVTNDQSIFDYLYTNKQEKDISFKIDDAFRFIIKHMKEERYASISFIDFTDIIKRSRPKIGRKIIYDVLEKFNRLDLRPSKLSSEKIIGEACDYLLSVSMEENGNKLSVEYSPKEISTLIGMLIKPIDDESIFDPACGVGGLLLNMYKSNESGHNKIYGQEINREIYTICALSMLLHGMEDAVIWQGNSLSNPKNVTDETLMQFDIAVSVPPFNVSNWGEGILSDTKIDDNIQYSDIAILDPYHRFVYGVPPVSKGDYAFILHMIACLKDKGRMAVVFPTGILFRGAKERTIRQHIVEDNLLDTVILLPANLLPYTSVPINILIFKKSRSHKDVLFIDASNGYEKKRKRNVLREDDIKHIKRVYEGRIIEPRFSYCATLDEIRKNNFNLSVARYVDTFEEKTIDIEAVNRSVINLETELTKIQAELVQLLKDL